MEWLALFGLALGVTIVVMFISWLWAVKVNNFSLVDAVWAFCFLLQASLFFIFSDGYMTRKILLLGMVGLWSCRLGYFLTRRIYGHHPEEDTRYKHLRSDYKDKFKSRFLLFYFYQAVSVSVLTLPFIFVFKNTSNVIGVFEIVGAIYWLIAVCGEAIADHQMSEFKKLSKENPRMGKTCNIGLWKYSRHPNYFFESNIWWGFFIFMIGSEVYWGIYSALIILFLLLKVTGVPPSEEQSLKTRGDEYRAYQKKTSMFIPWFQNVD
jgi:steroid 5-alpha reductase family enzyme